MICITGAGGTVGTEVHKQLKKRGASFRLAYFSKAKAELARMKGDDATIIDYNQPKTLLAAFQGCEKLFLLGPNVLNQVTLELNAVEAASVAGIQHIVKQSVMGAEAEAYSLARIHRPVEKAIESSGMAWTFLRPNSFMQNVVTYMRETIVTESSIFSSSGGAKISHVDVRDIARVAVQALTKPNHEGKSYTLTGPDAFTYDELASKLSRLLGRHINHINLPPSDLKKAMLAEGVPVEIADRMLDLERYFHEGHASPISNDIRQVTGQKPGGIEEFLQGIIGMIDNR